MDNAQRRKKLGFALCGSFCTHRAALEVMRELSAEYELVPILSYNAALTDTRFGSAAELRKTVASICSREPVTDITEAEKLGPSEPLDALLICPCTGNTAAKLSLGITDTPVTMAAKAHLRHDGRILIALSTNDGLSAGLENIGRLMRRKSFYFVPMRQDDITAKPHSLSADFSLTPTCLGEMEREIQHRPVFL